MPFSVLDTVVLVRDLPDHGLCSGDLGAIVEVYGVDRFDVEFVMASGRTNALVTLKPTDVRAIAKTDLVAVRSTKQSA